MTSLDDWRRLAEKSLKARDISALRTRTRDAILIEPLYQGRTDTLPLRRRTSGRPVLVQAIDHSDPDEANAQALEDLGGGATGLALRFAHRASGRGLPPSEAALPIVLAGIDLSAIQLRIEPHPNGPKIANWLRALTASSGYAPERTQISFGLDSVGQWAPHGEGALNTEAFVSCFLDLRAAGFAHALATLDSRPFHEAGATEAQELAAILGSAVFWLRALADYAVPAEAALPCFDASVAVDQVQLLSTAKLRALRLVWARLQEVCEVPFQPLFVHAETSRRMTTRTDPHANILRSTIAAFAAGAGGADSIAVLPFTEALGPADRSARALARNTQHLLMEESHLHRVADPGAGSGAIEALTDALAEKAWVEFQTIETEGGILESLRSGAFQTRVGEARERLESDLADGSTPLVGVTVFRDAGALNSAGDDVLSASELSAFAPARLEELVRGSP